MKGFPGNVFGKQVNNVVPRCMYPNFSLPTFTFDLSPRVREANALDPGGIPMV